MFYSLTAENLATGAVADTFKTFVGLIAAVTAGHRGRLRALIAGPADDAPADLNCCLRVNVTDNAGAGTSTAVTSANIPKADPAQRDSIMTGGVNYTAEPTTYATYPKFSEDFNRRGGLVMQWSREEAPCWGPNQTLGILAAPRTAAAATLSITVIWEEW